MYFNRWKNVSEDCIAPKYNPPPHISIQVYYQKTLDIGWRNAEINERMDVMMNKCQHLSYYVQSSIENQ